jgi:hypothetical protein
MRVAYQSTQGASDMASRKSPLVWAPDLTPDAASGRQLLSGATMANAGGSP